MAQTGCGWMSEEQTGSMARFERVASGTHGWDDVGGWPLPGLLVDNRRLYGNERWRPREQQRAMCRAIEVQVERKRSMYAAATQRRAPTGPF